MGRGSEQRREGEGEGTILWKGNSERGRYCGRGIVREKDVEGGRKGYALHDILTCTS